MNIVQLFRDELDREVERSRRVLEQVPDAQNDWKPHEKSMAFGYLADLVATMPMWIALIIRRGELDVAPKEGSSMPRTPKTTSQDYINALDSAAAEARSAFAGVDEVQLQQGWKLLAGGEIVAEMPRREMIRDSINHWAHHRGQLTVYLRLLGASIPAIYGPTADDKSFGPGYTRRGA